MTTLTLTQPRKSKFHLLLFAVLILLTGWFLLGQLGIHSLLRHGTYASEVNAMFDGNGRCNRGPSAEMYHPSLDTWTYICFDKDKVHLWILTKRVDQLWREITAIPGKDISRPVAYVSRLFTSGNEVTRWWGDIPSWFIDLMTSVK
jgi:hypothetical protein